MVNGLNLEFEKEDDDISSIQPVVNMNLASLEDLMNEPGEAETRFNEVLQDRKNYGIMLMQADMQRVSVLRIAQSTSHYLGHDSATSEK